MNSTSHGTLWEFTSLLATEQQQGVKAIALCVIAVELQIVKAIALGLSLELKQSKLVIPHQATQKFNLTNS
ncbi:hypothetical protein [Aliterella atlantica]|uniref:hypothetical protein n=1 Tax=Aliterella atlantica TaxID=1827278 RepID=UPI0005D33572|nr:hypothetical protein [Aliterella atlantica]